jgi:hypothetical protein
VSDRPAVSRLSAVDRWLFAPLPPDRVHRLRSMLAALIALRLLLSPFRAVADVPDALFLPVTGLLPFRSVPSAGVIVAVQAVGVAAAVLAATSRRSRFTLPVAWLCLFALAGLRSSLGKILHNDVLLLIATLPFLVAPDTDEAEGQADAPNGGARSGWPVRTAMALIALTYFVTGVQKLVHSGLAWVTSDNMRWILYAAASEGRAVSKTPALFVADHPWLATSSAALLLGLELLFPLALFSRRARPLLVAAAAAMHAGTWLLLGLDYWVWAAVVAAVFLLGEPLTPGDPTGRLPVAAAPPRSRD